MNGSVSSAELKRNTQKDDGKIIVTTIQKLNNLMKNEDDLSIYQKEVVFIFVRVPQVSVWRSAEKFKEEI